MKKILLFSVIVSAALLTAFAPNSSNSSNPVYPVVQAGNWTVDKAHTNVKFSVSHLVISDVDGTFQNI